MKRPFVFIGSSIFISLMLYSYCGLTSAIAVFAVSAVFCIPLFIFRKKHAAIYAALLCAISLLTAALTFTVKTVNEYLPAQKLCTENEAIVSGDLVEYRNDYGYNYYILDNISVNGAATKNKIRINSAYFSDAEIGDRMTFTADEIRSKAESNSYLHYKSEGIYITAYSTQLPEKITAQSRPVTYYFDRLRDFISVNIKKNIIDEYAPAVDAMITGNTSEMSTEVRNNFSYSGISHFFAVSGFHLTLWTACIYFLLSSLPFRVDKRIRSIISILFIIFFMALTGFSSSVVRAGIMQIILFASFFTKYKSDPLNSLFAALSAILIFNPFAVSSISLQMSFFATLGIIIISEPLSETVEKIKDSIRIPCLAALAALVYSIFAVSVVATLFTIFISAQCFGYYSVAGPITNILCVTVAQLVMPLAVLGIAFSWLPAAEKPMSLLCDVIMKYIYKITEEIADLSYCIIDSSSQDITLVIIIITLLLLLSLVIFYGRSKFIRISVITACIAVAAVSACTEISTANTHKITVSDVGNGTAVVYNAGNRNIVIGCGGSLKKQYRFDDTLNLICADSIDLLLIPRSADSESEYACSLFRRYNFDKVILSQEEYSPMITMSLPENTVYSSEMKINIDEKTDLLYINNDSFSGVKITAQDFSCTIIFRATSDFSAVSSEWAQGNLLITRQNPPLIDTSGFDAVFVSTNNTEPFEDDRIYSTKTDGKLIYRTTMTRGDIIYAVK